MEILHRMGMNANEAKIYLSLLEYGSVLASVVSYRTNIKRANAYFILDEMVKKGFATKIKIGAYYHYQPVSPDHLLERQSSILEDLSLFIPRLKERQGRFAVQPQVTVFNGKQGVIQVMEDSLNAKGDILGWADIDEASTGYLQDYYPSYIKKKNSKKIWVRAIFTEGPEARRFQKEGPNELREAYVIPKENFIFQNEVNIYDNKMFIISHADQIAILIENERIAETQRSLFKLAWLGAKSLDTAGVDFYKKSLKSTQLFS